VAADFDKRLQGSRKPDWSIFEEQLRRLQAVERLIGPFSKYLSA
jgi:hypothetical protein